MSLLDLLRRPSRGRGIVLALGGGGARGLAHLGVLAHLEEDDLPVVAVAGTSAGALIGAMWLIHGSAGTLTRWREFLQSGLLPASLPDTRLTDEVSSRDNLLFQFARRLKTGATVALALNRRGLATAEELDRAIAFLVPDLLVEDLRLPFAAVATDFFTGQPITLRRGPLREVIAASSGVPGLVPPRLVGGRALIDGGVVEDVPVAAARALARGPVVAVDVGELPAPDDPGEITVPRAIMRANIITHGALREVQLAEADLVLRPGVGTLHWSEFARLDEALAAGRAAAVANRNRLRAAALRRRPRAGG
ncbi:MAG: patatin-like phospholipase family protein [Acidobacteriota bacterium]